MSFGTFGMNFLSWVQSKTYATNGSGEDNICNADSIPTESMRLYLAENHGLTESRISDLELDNLETLDEYENYLVPICPCDMCKRQRGEL